MDGKVTQRMLLTAVLAGLTVFLYLLKGILGRVNDWSVFWLPPTQGEIAGAVAAALVAITAALGLDVPTTVKGLFTKGSV
jgi:hypothetical protein